MAPWPLPQYYTHGSSVLWPSRDVSYTFKSIQVPAGEFEASWGVGE